MVIGLYYGIHHNPEVADKIEQANSGQTILIYAVFIAITGIFVLLMWLFYKLIYGLLLKRLNKNYKELKKLDF